MRRAFTDSTMDDGRTGRDKYLTRALRSLCCHNGSTSRADMICFKLVGDVLVFSTKFFVLGIVTLLTFLPSAPASRISF